MANSAFDHSPSITVPGSSTNIALVRWSGTGGKTFLDSTLLLSTSATPTLGIAADPDLLTFGNGTIAITGAITGVTTITATQFVGGGVGITALNGTQITSGTVPVAQLGSSGSRSSSTFLNGANAWAAAGGGDLSFGGDTFGADKVIGSNDAYSLAFETDGTTRMHIAGATAGSTEAGWVGIGTTTPVRPLDLRYSGSRAQLRLARIGSATGEASLGAGDNMFSIMDSSYTRLLNVATSGGDVTVVSGNVVIGTAGKGIDFSATSNAGTTTPSELLDDYEEGTWTPTIRDAPSGNSAGHAAQVGQYTKIGTQVWLSWTVVTNSISGMTGGYTAVVAGMPFTPRSTSNLTQVGVAIVQGANLGNDSAVVLQAVAGTAAMNTHQFDTNAGTTEVTVTEFGASATMRASISYPI